MSCQVSTDSSNSFTWDEYLQKTNGRPAKPECFKQSIVPPLNKFEVNTILEAEDQRSTALVLSPLAYSADVVSTRRTKLSGSPLILGTSCKRSSWDPHFSGTFRRFRAASFSLARVIETCGPRLRIRLVGTDDRNDYWFLVDSDQIRAYPSGNPLQPPFGYMHNHLVWNRTLKKATEGARFADPSWFVKQPPDPEDNYFQVNDKLEAVDRRNTQLICPASVGAVNGHHILISFDGWSGAFDYWTRFDSRELFPVGWCKLANYPLQAPGPNVVRSPNIHSTPALLYTPQCVAQTLCDSSKGASNISSSTCNRITKKSKTSFSRKRSRLSSQIKRHNNLIRNKLCEEAENATPYTHSCELSAKPCVNTKKAFSQISSKSNSHGVLSDRMDNFENEQNSFIVLNSLNVTSVGSSNHSLSSPSVIPPILEDASDSLSVFYSSSPPDHPPCIEASESLYDYTAEGHQQISNSSDCVVRLQAQPSVIKMSSIINPQEPGLKSWKVVTKTKQNDKRSKQKRLSGTFGKGHSKFKHKLKLIKRKLTSPMLCNFDFVDSVPCDVNGLSDINHDYRTSQTYPEGDPCIYGNQANIIASHQDGARLNCTPLCSAERTNVLKSKVNRRMTHPLGSSMLFRTHAFRESIHPNAYCSDETDSPTCENLSIEVSDTPSWFSGKIESSSSRSSYPVYAQQNIDSLDNQSCTTHLPSSTVSPSSLDLGSLPFPNPTQWTIDEVYTYITTRDTSLLEAAEKFKHHEIDGQALLLLSMESLRHYMKIKLGPALKMVHLINRLKRGLL